MYFVPGCCHCGSGCAPAAINATALCCGTGSPLSGFTFDLRDSADTTTLATQTGSSASFTGQDGTLSYKVRVSKAGYHTKTSGTLTPGCGGTVSTSVSTWPTTYSLSNHVRLQDYLVNYCPLSGATVAYTGDGSDSDTTDASGNATSSLSSSSTACTQTLNYTITPPSGHGAAVKTGTISVNPCSPASQTFTLDPSTGHVAVICNARYMPEDLDWVDDFGACTVTWGSDVSHSESWAGSYVYESTNAINDADCGGIEFRLVDQTADVTVNCRLDYDSFPDSDCTDSVFVGTRKLRATSSIIECTGGITGFVSTKCQPLADEATGSHDLTTGTDPFSYSCPASVAINFDIDAEVCGESGTYEETAVTVDVTGTIT